MQVFVHLREERKHNPIFSRDVFVSHAGLGMRVRACVRVYSSIVSG